MNHPYKSFEGCEQWNIIKHLIEEMVENNDIELYTPIEYVVGYLSKGLMEENICTENKKKNRKLL